MATSCWQLPDTPRLEAGLAAAFNTNGQGGLKVLKRTLSPYSTTFPCEVVSCRLPGNKKTDVFCKYSAGIDYTGFGHRGGPAYELAVYREVLQPIGVSAPVSPANADSQNSSWARLDQGLHTSILPGVGSSNAKVLFVAPAEASVAGDHLSPRRRSACAAAGAATQYRPWRVLSSQCSVPLRARLPSGLGIGCQSGRGNRHRCPDGRLVRENDTELHSRLSAGAMARRRSSRFRPPLPRRAPLPVLSLAGR